MNKEFQDPILEWPGLEAKRNFFSTEILKKIRLQINKADFKKVFQERNSHYSHVFKSKSERISEPRDLYLKIFQSIDEEANDFKRYNRPIIGKELKKECQSKE